jgi:hypothetical protein
MHGDSFEFKWVIEADSPDGNGKAYRWENFKDNRSFVVTDVLKTGGACRSCRLELHPPFNYYF